MVANVWFMYNPVPVFEVLETPLYRCSYTPVSNRHELPFMIVKTQTDARPETINFISKPGVFFRDVELNDFMNSFISCSIESPHIIDPSDVAIRKVLFNQNKSRLSVMNLSSPGPVTGQTICKSAICKIPFAERSVRDSLVHFNLNKVAATNIQFSCILSCNYSDAQTQTF